MSSHPETQTTSDLEEVADAIRGHERFVVTTHENPDGDALGSLLATKLALDQLGKDALMVLHGDAPLPAEYGFLQLDELRRRWPDDVSERVFVALDCANESRIADPEILGRVPLSLDIDHHHDNTRFARINLIDAEASSSTRTRLRRRSGSRPSSSRRARTCTASFRACTKPSSSRSSSCSRAHS